MSNGMMSPTAFDELTALLQELGIYEQQNQWTNTGYGVNDDAYYDLVTNGSGVTDQFMVANKIGLGTLVADSFANAVHDPAERERMRQELAAKQLEKMRAYQQAYTGTANVATNNPNYNANGVPSFSGGAVGAGGNVTNPNVDEPPPSTVVPEAGPMTMRGASTPFMDSYMRAREAAQKQGPVSSMFAQELNKE